MVGFLSPQSIYSAVDDLRSSKADRQQIEVEVREVGCVVVPQQWPKY